MTDVLAAPKRNIIIIIIIIMIKAELARPHPTGYTLHPERSRQHPARVKLRAKKRASRLKAGAPEQTQYREHDSYRAQTVEGTIMS
jgi:hypothetical protein